MTKKRNGLKIIQEKYIETKCELRLNTTVYGIENGNDGYISVNLNEDESICA